MLASDLSVAEDWRDDAVWGGWMGSGAGCGPDPKNKDPEQAAGHKWGWRQADTASQETRRRRRDKTDVACQTGSKWETRTYLRLAGRVLIVAVRRSAQGRARSVLASANTAALGQVLLPLCPADFNLLLLTTTAQLLGLEGAFRLELSPPVLGDVPFGHGCDMLFR